MEEISGEVLSIVFYNPDEEFVVARFRTRKEGAPVTIVGNMGRIAPGVELTLYGKWRVHPRFGRQFQVSHFIQNLPATEVGIKRYLSSGLIKGIGPVIASRLLKRFGVEVLNILDKEPERLLEVNGIGEKTLKKIRASWEEQQEVRNIILFLQEHEIAPSFAVKIFRAYGKESLKRLKKNPYDLAYDIRGIGFKTADKIALRLGFSEDCPMRIEAAVVYTLFKLSEAGHLFYPRDRLIQMVIKILDIDSVELIEGAIFSLSEKKRIYIERLEDKGIEAVYLRHFYKWEVDIASRLAHMMLSPFGDFSDGELPSLLEKMETRFGIRLSDEQRQAVLGACTNKVFIITGGPGTGKTTIIRFIALLLKEMGASLRLAAPTGRAAKRLSEATFFPASTLHRLLGFGKGGEFQYNEDRKLKINCLIIDETSMVDCQLFYHLLRALPITCRLILIGDVNQLPSVGPGNLLRDMIGSKRIPTRKLTTIYRQAKESMIVVNAHRINKGIFPVRSKKEPPECDFFWIEEENPSMVQRLMVHMVCERIPEVYGFDPIRQVQVLSPMHKGEIGTSELNRLFQEKLNPLKGRSIPVLKGFRRGDKVIQLANNYDKEVFNGDMGIIADIDVEEGEVLVDFDGRMVLYDQGELDEISLAYCISIHKAQGSEYPAVLFPVMLQHYIMLQRNLIYTALTRAKRLAIVFGGRKAMAIGLKNVTREERFTCLKQRIIQACSSLLVVDN